MGSDNNNKVMTMSDDDWVEGELDKWGRYMRDNDSLTFPKCSPESKGPGVSTSKGGGFMPEDIERMENAILHLPGDLRAVVVCCHVECRSASREYQARRLTEQLGRNVTRRRLTEDLTYARGRLASFYQGRNW